MGNKKGSPKATAKETKTKKAKQEKQVKEKKQLGFMPYLLVLIAVLLVLMFTMDQTGYLGNILTPAFMGLFGYGVYFIPFYLVVLALFWKTDRENNVMYARCLLCILNFIFVLSLVHLHTTTDAQRSFTQEQNFLKVFYKNGVNGTGAGVFGGLIGSGLDFLIGSVLTYILGYLTAIISFIFLIGTTPLKILRAIGRFLKNISHSLRVMREREAERAAERAAKEEKTAKKEETPSKKSKKPEVVYIQPESNTEIPPVEIKAEQQPIKTVQDEYQSIFEEKETPLVLPKTAMVEPPVEVADEVKEVEVDIETIPAERDEKSEVTENNEEVAQTNELDVTHREKVYVFPPLSLLSEGSSDFLRNSSQNIAVTGQKLISVLRTYGVKATLVSTSRGPAVTRYEVLPDEGIRVSRIEGLADDIRMRLAASSVRIESNIPGKAAIGIEIPNETASIVKLRDLIDNDIFRNNPSKLFVCLGVDVGGNPVYFDIPDMPHLLIAGATGMGKSVCINSLIISLLYRATPDEVKFILIDPKKIELSCYNGIPHLLVPVVNEPRTAAGSLNWAVNEMERRYTQMEQMGARNLEEYNEIIEGDPEKEKLPYIVIVIDELADLIMSAKDAVENSICRLAQKARAAGIHLIVGTQRPSTDVITGLIKANIPSRIAFTVSQSVDSRIILDENGAEALLGKGDMIYAPVKMMKKLRVQGAYVDGKSEVAAVCQFIKSAAQVEYNDDVIKMIEEEARLCGDKNGKRRSDDGGSSIGDEKEDPLFIDALGVAFEYDTMSTSLLQRKLSVGYARAQKIIDMMEDRGYVGKFDPATKKRKVLITKAEFDEMRLAKSGEVSDA
ncbi:MAG: DNA translocase FtsK [Eubacteriales bacterium]|jgi:S-DNA-T family DNA segregation ATPase FtsK/SpoIIIE